MKLFSNPVSFTATQSAGTFLSTNPPANVENSAVNLNWVTNDTTGAQTLKLVLPSLMPIAGLLYYEMSPPTTLYNRNLFLGWDDDNWDTIPNPTIIENNYNQRKYLFDFIENGYTRDYDRFWLQFTGGPGSGRYRIGACYVFRDYVDIINPEYGASLNRITPNINNELANGARAKALTGPPYEILDLTFNQPKKLNYQNTEVEEIAIGLDRGPICLKMDNSYDYHFWVLVSQNDQVKNVQRGPQYDRISYSLRELVTM